MANTSNESLQDIERIRQFRDLVEQPELKELTNKLLTEIEKGLASEDEKIKAMAKAALDDMSYFLTVDYVFPQGDRDEKNRKSKARNDALLTYTNIIKNSLIIEKYNKLIEASMQKQNSPVEDHTQNQEQRIETFLTQESGSEDKHVEALNALSELCQKAGADYESADINTRVIAKNTLDNIEKNLIPFYKEKLATGAASPEDLAIFQETIKAHKSILHAMQHVEPESAMLKVVEQYGKDLSKIVDTEHNNDETTSTGDNTSIASSKKTAKETAKETAEKKPMFSTRTKIIMGVLLAAAVAAFIVACIFCPPVALFAAPLIHFAFTIGPFFQSVFTSAHMITGVQATFYGIGTAIQGIGTGLTAANTGAQMMMGSLQTGANYNYGITLIALGMGALIVRDERFNRLVQKTNEGIGAGYAATRQSILDSSRNIGHQVTKQAKNFADLFKSKPKTDTADINKNNSTEISGTNTKRALVDSTIQTKTNYLHKK